METIAHFFDSNFFVGLITLVVGSIALYIYRKQQIDFKRSAANTILLEITSAEKLIESAKLKIGETRREGFTLIPEHHYVMPMESWSKYKSLFVSDFTTKEWDRISKFYNDCTLFDETIAYNDATFIKDTTEIRKNVHRGLYKYISSYADIILEEKDETKIEELKEELKKKKALISELMTNSEFMHTYRPNKPIRDIEMLIDTIDTKISLGKLGRKLHKLSQ